MWVVFKKYFPIKDFNFSYLQRTCNHRFKSSRYIKSSFNFPWIQNLHGMNNNIVGIYNMVDIKLVWYYGT